MTDTNKILIGVGVVGALGVGVYLLTRKSGGTTTTITTTGGGGSNQNDPSTSTVDSLGTTIGNLFSELFAKKEKENNTTTAPTCEAPADPYTADGIKADDYSSSEIEKMQVNLSDLSPDIKVIIDASGGVDGYIGPGFKTAYNMARKSCKISSIQNIT